MKKLIAVFVVLMMAAGAAQACPKGTHPHGGTGSHHAGGTCF